MFPLCLLTKRQLFSVSFPVFHQIPDFTDLQIFQVFRILVSGQPAEGYSVAAVKTSPQIKTTAIESIDV